MILTILFGWISRSPKENSQALQKSRYRKTTIYDTDAQG